MIPLFLSDAQAIHAETLSPNTKIAPLTCLWNYRLCDLGTVDLQRFVLQKMESGLGWESANHFRNLVSKVFEMARKWNFYSGSNPASGVSLPEKNAVREKHALQPDQIRRLLAMLSEPVRTMVLLGILTGMRIGEILGLRRKDVDFSSGQVRIEQACYRGLLGSPKTKGSRRTLPLPNALVIPLAPHICACKANWGGRFGISDPQWNSVERHQPAAPTFETGRWENRSTLAELAHTKAHPRYAVTASGRLCGTHKHS